MRKAQRQEILEMIQTLQQAHGEIKSNVEKRDFVSAQDILTLCQECAITMGTTIEKSEGEGFITVLSIESYCDVVFAAYEELSGSDVNANKIYNNLKKQLLLVENSVKNDIPIRREIAFFPYKASMWDSLESVYLAAREDPDCDAYCVPIPYYDKNPDGSFREMHYEGSEYPDNIEVIDWRTYNFEERKPDAIYIHNPYDECNYVTSVHPRFYASNLIKYTVELVYIPYFVLGEIDPADQPAIEGMKHFCFLPGTIYADKVILQSENMRRIYINEYMKEVGQLDDQELRKKLEKRFLGLGSPKFDKVMNTRKEDLEIPKDWLQIIEKPDGGWKKIIFYNTSVSALLQNDDKMLKKMEDVFRIFKENKEEVALLWRPHPLIQATIESMRPQLWKAYQKIKDRYIEGGWGIYDDTPDMDRAVILSDVYYGDPSSIVQMYKLTKKKIVMQEPLAYGKYRDLNIETSLLYLDTIYVLSRNGVLYRRKENENTYCYLAQISKIWTSYQYRTMAGYKDNLYFFPYYADEIAIYNIKSQKVSYIEVESSKQKFYKACICNNQFVFLLGEMKSEEICINLDNMCIQKKYKWKEQIAQELEENVCEYFHKSVPVVVGSTFYLPLSKDNYILKYDMNNFEYELLKVGDKKIKYSSMCFKNGIMWLFGDDNYITLWYLETNRVEYLPISNHIISMTNECPWRDLFSKCILMENYIYLFPLKANEIIKVNCDDFSMKQVYSLQEQSLIFSAEGIGVGELYFCEETLPLGNDMNDNYLLCSADEVKINPIDKQVFNEEYKIIME